MNKNKYSDWLKIDLHIHTDWSRKTKENDYEGVFSVDILHEKLKHNQVEIFSLTDHNIINTVAYREYYDKYSEENDPLLLLGVELDICRKGVLYHSLIIFNHSTINKAENIASKLEKYYTDKGQEQKHREITIEDIVELFPDDDFFFIPHADGEKSIVNSYRDDIPSAQKMILLMQSCALEKVDAKKIRTYNEGFDQVMTDSFKKRADIAYIDFSDNHNISNYPCKHKGHHNPKDHSLFYIKGGKNYETIRLAFIDPESRIKSPLQFACINQNTNKIEKLKIHADRIFYDCELTFSPHLNVIIGGRSSGKSLLMSIFKKKIDKLSNKDNIYKHVDYSSAEIKTKLDSDYKDIASVQHDILLLNQGDIIRYFEDNKLNDLINEANKEEQFSEALNKFINHKYILKYTIDNLIKSYKNVQEGGINNRYILHNSIIENILSRDYIFKFDIDDINNYNDISAELTEIQDNLNSVQNTINLLKNNIILEFNDDENIIIQNFEELLNSKKEFISNKSIKNTKKADFIQSVSLIVEEVNSTLDAGAQQKIMSKRQLDELQKDILDTFRYMYSLKTDCYKLEEFEYSIIERIDLDNETTFVMEAVNSENIKEYVLDAILDPIKERSIYLNMLRLLRNITKIKNYPDNDFNTLSKKFQTVLERLFGSLDSPIQYLEYKSGANSKDNSPGFNSEKYLEIILQNPNTKMIFIDQPEDNLGNKYIAQTLVKKLREIKFQKQLFLVTHNPAIVVYGDAEAIIIAENNNNMISYRQIVLEDMSAQKEICGILDGGEYIFDNRSKKYNIQRILSVGS